MTAGGTRTGRVVTDGHTSCPPSCRRMPPLPVVDGGLALGTWQSIALVDLNADNTERTVRLSLLICDRNALTSLFGD